MARFTAILLAFLVIFTGNLYAQDEPEISALLAGFLQNDRTLMELTVKLKQADISREKTLIENGFDLSLSTGTLRVVFGDSTDFSAKPSAELSFPSFNSTSLSISASVSSDDPGIKDASARISTAILSPAAKQRKVTLLTAERSVTEAEREVKKRALSAEKEFYERLSALYNYETEALSLEDAAYTKEIDAALAKMQGYNPSSVYYRTIQLEVDDKRRSAKEQRRVLERELAVFARDCGAVTLKTLPLSLPPLDIAGFSPFGSGENDKSRFSEIESSLWNQTIGKMTREAQGNLEIKAYTGVTLNNTNTDSNTSADAGVSLDWQGTSVTVGGEFPVTGGNPAFTLQASFNLNSKRTAALTEREKRLKEETEALAVKNAERSWEDTVYTTRREWEDLLWQRQQAAEQYELYTQLAEDTSAAHERGIVSDSEWRKALANKESAAYKLLACDIKIRTHQISAALYFVEK